MRKFSIGAWVFAGVLLFLASAIQAGKFDKTTSDDEDNPPVIALFVSSVDDFIHRQVPGRPKKDGTPTMKDEKTAILRVAVTDVFTKATHTLTALKTPDLTKQVKQFKAGDYIKLATRKTDLEWMSWALPYKLKDGEDGPNSFVLKSVEKKKIEGSERVGLMLDRFGKGGIVWVPQVRRNGNSVSDPELLKRIETFAPDDVLEVTTGQGGGLPLIVTAFKYQPTRAIVFQEFTKVTLGGSEYDAIAAQDGINNATILVPKFEEFPGKFTTNRKLLAALKSVKKGEIVLCKTYTGEDGKILLREAQATGKTDLAAVPGASVTATSSTMPVEKATAGKPAVKPDGKLPDEPVDITAPGKPAPPAKKPDASLPAEP